MAGRSEEDSAKKSINSKVSLIPVFGRHTKIQITFYFWISDTREGIHQLGWASHTYELRDLFRNEDANLVAVTKHGGENVLQEGQHVLVGLKQTPHGLQLHHLRIRALCNFDVQQKKHRHNMLRANISANVGLQGNYMILGRSRSHTVAYFFHYKGVEADLVNALVQTVGLVDLLHLLVEHHLLRVGQLRAQYPVVEFLWEVKRVGHLSSLCVRTFKYASLWCPWVSRIVLLMVSGSEVREGQDWAIELNNGTTASLKWQEMKLKKSIWHVWHVWFKKRISRR